MVWSLQSGLDCVALTDPIGPLAVRQRPGRRHFSCHKGRTVVTNADRDCVQGDLVIIGGPGVDRQFSPRSFRRARTVSARSSACSASRRHLGMRSRSANKRLSLDTSLSRGRSMEGIRLIGQPHCGKDVSGNRPQHTNERKQSGEASRIRCLTRENCRTIPSRCWLPVTYSFGD